jgi:hypothetical protein
MKTQNQSILIHASAEKAIEHLNDVNYLSDINVKYKGKNKSNIDNAIARLSDIKALSLINLEGSIKNKASNPIIKDNYLETVPDSKLMLISSIITVFIILLILFFI